MVTSVVLWSIIWKLRNECCFQRIGRKSMEVLLYRIHGHLKNWKVLCPGDKTNLLDGYLEKIKVAAKMVRWLPGIQKGRYLKLYRCMEAGAQDGENYWKDAPKVMKEAPLTP